MLNRFYWVKPQYTMHINLFKPVLFMLNRFDRLKHPHPMQINRCKPV